MATRKRKRRAGRRDSISAAPVDSPRSRSSSLSLPAVPGLDDAGDVVGSSDSAIAALEQSTAGAANTEHDDAGDDAGTSPTSVTPSSAETAISNQPPTADSGAPHRDRSPAKDTPASGKKSDKPKPIALRASELKGMQQRELRTMVATLQAENEKLVSRLQAESPIAQAAMDKDLQEAIGETFSLVGDGAAFFSGYEECKFPKPTTERLGRVWAPIAKKYMADYAEHMPLFAAASATIAALVDRAASVKIARDERREADAERKKAATTAAPAT